MGDSFDPNRGSAPPSLVRLCCTDCFRRFRTESIDRPHGRGCNPENRLFSSQLLLGHTKLESTVCYLGIEVDDALEMAEQTEV